MGMGSNRGGALAQLPHSSPNAGGARYGSRMGGAKGKASEHDPSPTCSSLAVTELRAREEPPLQHETAARKEPAAQYVTLAREKRPGPTAAILPPPMPGDGRAVGSGIPEATPPALGPELPLSSTAEVSLPTSPRTIHVTDVHAAVAVAQNVADTSSPR